jgi:glycoside/pentoside/hexuronide:cation symporter, GPH family
VGGPFLDLIGLKAGMQPGDAPQSVIWGLGLIMGPGLGLMLAIPAWVAYKIDLDMSSHLDIQEALRKRVIAQHSSSDYREKVPDG